MPRVSNALKITHKLKIIKTDNYTKSKHNKLFIMLKRNSVNVHLRSSHCKFGACQK